MNPYAFPTPSTQTANGDMIWGQDGMTLRDYFAGQIIARVAERYSECDGKHAEKEAEMAYRYADAMLAERSKTQS